MSGAAIIVGLVAVAVVVYLVVKSRDEDVPSGPRKEAPDESA